MQLSLSNCPHVAAELSRIGRSNPSLHCWYDAVCSRLAFPAQDCHAKTLTTYLCCDGCPLSDRLKCLPLLTCCTSCSTFLCMKHMPAHLRDEKHPLALSLVSGQIYCLYCADFVYAPCLEKLRRDLIQKFRRRMGFTRKIYMPRREEIAKFDRLIWTYKPIEVRGLYNMGNTCYMNCVLQALVHTPLLKTMFSEDRVYYCQQQKGSCFHCELITLVKEMNESNQLALAAPRLLWLLWKLAPHLSGYRQHDAQEFFLAAHDLMHRHFIKEDDSLRYSDRCACCMHTIFCGLTSSRGSCMNCGHHWISGEGLPFLDVQLNIPETSKKIHLKDCLNEFCREEVISDCICERCNSKPISRQTKFRCLPAVLVFHLKRFKLSPSGIVANSTKVNTEVDYDLKLDMSDYLTEYDKTPDAYDPSTSQGILERLGHTYSLFAIVSHSGSMQVGHYVSYVKTRRDTWWKCDDQLVNRIGIDAVTSTEAYMLFYQLDDFEFI